MDGKYTKESFMNKTLNFHKEVKFTRIKVRILQSEQKIFNDLNKYKETMLSCIRVNL